MDTPDSTAKLQNPTLPATISRTGKAPKNRITTAEGAKRMYDDAMMQWRLEDSRLSALRGMYDGFPPEDPEKMAQQGLKDLPNVNFRQLQAKVDGYVATWVSVNVKGDKWAEVQLRRENFESVETWRKAGELVTNCFNKAFKYWENTDVEDASHFLAARAVCDTQMGIYGKGLLHFEDHIDWRVTPVPNRKAMASRGTKIPLRNCSALFIEKEYTVSRLWSYVADEQTAKETGWSRKAVIELLFNRVEQQWPGFTGTVASLAAWENMARNNDTTWLYEDFRPIDLVHCYFAEFQPAGRGDGITHCVIPKVGTGKTEFVYFKDRQFSRWTQILIPFCDRPGPEGDWHGVKGLADTLFDTCQMTDTLRNHAAKAAIIGSLPMMQADDESDREKLKQVVFSPLGLLMPGIRLAELKINADLSGLVEVIQDSDRLANQNSRTYPQGESVGGDVKTATQATYDRQDQTSLTTLQVDWYRATGADPLVAEQYRRLTASASDYPEIWPGGETAKWFRDKMKGYGLTPKQYQEVDYVRASRTGASGNQALDTYKANTVLGIASPGVGQRNARAELVASLYGYERIGEFIQEDGQPTPEQVVIGLENTTLQNAQAIDAYGFQSHEIHLGQPSAEGMGHLALLATAQMAAEQIMETGIDRAMQDAMKLANVLEVATAHAGQHAQFLSQMGFRKNIPEMAQATNDLMKLLNDFTQFTENFKEAIATTMERVQKEQQPQQQDPEAAALMAKTQAEIEALMAKTQADIEAMQQKHSMKLAMQAETTQSRTRSKEAANAQTLGIQAQQAAIDAERQKAELQQDMMSKTIDTAMKVSAEKKKAAAKEKPPAK